MAIEFIVAWVTSTEALKFVLTFIFGGGAFTLVKTYFTGKEVHTNSKIAKQKTPIEISNLNVSGLETLAKNLQADNEVLREDRDYWKSNYEKVREEVERLSDALEEQERVNQRLRMEVNTLRASLEDMEAASPAAQSHRSGLREFDDSEYPDSTL